MGEYNEDWFKDIAGWLSARQMDQQQAAYISTSNNTNAWLFALPKRTHMLDCGIVQFGARSSEQAAVCPEGRGTVVLIQKPNGDIAARIEVVK